MESQLNKDNHLVQDEDEHSSKESKLSDPPFLADMGEHLSTLEMSILEKTADDAKEHLLTLESSTSEKAADDAKEHLPTLESSASEEIADDAKEKLLTHELTTSEKPTGDAKAQGVETMECDLKGEIPLTTEILHESLLATDLEQEVSTIEKTADDAKEKLTIHELTRSEHPTGDAKAQDVEVMECDPKREIPLTPQILHESLLATGLEQVTDVLYVAITGPDDVSPPFLLT